MWIIYYPLNFLIIMFISMKWAEKLLAAQYISPRIQLLYKKEVSSCSLIMLAQIVSPQIYDERTGVIGDWFLQVTWLPESSHVISTKCFLRQHKKSTLYTPKAYHVMVTILFDWVAFRCECEKVAWNKVCQWSRKC